MCILKNLSEQALGSEASGHLCAFKTNKSRPASWVGWLREGCGQWSMKARGRGRGEGEARYEHGGNCGELCSWTQQGVTWMNRAVPNLQDVCVAPEPSRAQLGGSMGAFFRSPFCPGQVEQNPGAEPFSRQWHRAGQPSVGAVVGKACLCLISCSQWSVVGALANVSPREVWSLGSDHTALHLLSPGYLWSCEMSSQTWADILSRQGRPPCQFEI